MRATSADLTDDLRCLGTLAECRTGVRDCDLHEPRFRPLDDIRLRLDVDGEIWSARLIHLGRSNANLLVDDDLARRLPAGARARLGYEAPQRGIVWLNGALHARRLPESAGTIVAFDLCTSG